MDNELDELVLELSEKVNAAIDQSDAGTLAELSKVLLVEYTDLLGKHVKALKLIDRLAQDGEDDDEHETRAVG